MNQFNIRVYGLPIKNGKILITDEIRGGIKMTKFVGGGLEFGEGIAACLKREFQEELSIDISNQRHFYTTDFFQQSAFNINHQLISIYYLVELNGEVETVDTPFQNIGNGEQCFRWVALSKLDESNVTFPIDKHVIGLINQSAAKPDFQF